MRIALACLLVAALHAGAAADAKITQLVKFYEKELGTCKKNARGVTVVLERGQPVATSDSELAADLAEIEKLGAIVQGQCDEIAAMIEFLKSDPTATYKQIQKDFAERDKKVRTGRAASKQALVDVQPLVSRSVPRINKLIATADAAARPSTREQKAVQQKEDKAAAEKAAADKAAADKAAAEQAAAEKKAAQKAAAEKAAAAKVGARFPSGRTVELPAPTEAWTISGTADTDIAEYASGAAKGVVIVRARPRSPSCEQIRASAALLSGRTAPQASDASVELKALKSAWILSWTEGDRQVRALCVTTKQGALVGRTEALGATAALDVALARMVTARMR